MAVFTLDPGADVLYNQQRYRIIAAVSLTTVRIACCTTGETTVVPVAALAPPIPLDSVAAADALRSQPPDLMQIPTDVWAEAQRRVQIIGPLAALDVCPRSSAQAAAAQLGCSVRHIYTLRKAYRMANGALTALMPHKPSGGKGKGRLPGDLEALIRTTIEEVYLTPQKCTMQRVVDEVRRRCAQAHLRPPSGNAIRRRIQTLSPEDTMRRREGAQRAHQHFTPVTGTFPPAPWPLAVVQMDHTPVDLIVVDAQDRRPIGRPYLTVAIDVYSRCITGFCVTLEAPSAVSVGLCLAHAVLDKEPWLAQRGVAGPWPIWGKPACLHVDNAAEFHSEALQRGCEQHGIALQHRPVGQPHYGGTVERVLGTLMHLIHQLPGTTFSHPTARGAYDADRMAALTLADLERWLTVAITEHYHRTFHRGLGGIPLERYTAGILGTPDAPGRGYPPKIRDPQAFLIDFLPVERRTLQRHGFRLDHIDYYSPALRPLLARGERSQSFLIRRDPRDLSRIYVLDPVRNHYLDVSYRILVRPAITLWEHQHAVRTLREQGMRHVDEATLFHAIDQMRAITEAAVATSKAARRQRERTRHAAAGWRPPDVSESAREEAPPTPVVLARPFEDIELWEESR